MGLGANDGEVGLGEVGLGDVGLAGVGDGDDVEPGDVGPGEDGPGDGLGDAGLGDAGLGDAGLGDGLRDELGDPPGTRQRAVTVLPSSMETVNTMIWPGVTSIIRSKMTSPPGRSAIVSNNRAESEVSSRTHARGVPTTVFACTRMR